MKSSAAYYKLTPLEIYGDINDNSQEVIKSQAEGIHFLVFPHVYPSHKFRTTAFLLKNLKMLVKGKIVCDMGCGPGIVGLFALHNGAKQVIQAEINAHAVDNAKENNLIHGFGTAQIKTFLSDCFDSIPQTFFDLIVFNIPYHCDRIHIDDPLKYAFYDPAFASISKFLKQAKNYSNKKTKIIVAFSNKGDVDLLEHIFEQHGYKWELWKVTNTDQQFDNRLYLLANSKK